MQRYVDEMAFGARVRQARIKAGLSQHELGERVGMHQTMVAKREQANSPTRVSEIWALADALGVSAEWLLVGGSTPFTDAYELGKQHGSSATKRAVLRLITDSEVL